MDRLKLSRIDEELDSSEVAALCFLCLDVVNKKRLEGIKDARGLFSRLEEKGMLENGSFLSQLLQTIRRTDLLSYLETDSRQPEETDASPTLSAYRVMLYNIYDDMTQENLKKMKFLLGDKLFRRQTEASDTALDLFIKMENTGILSNTNLLELLGALQELDQQLASTVQQYIDQLNQQHQTRVQPHVSMDYQRVNNRSLRTQLSISETEPSYEGRRIPSDAEQNEEPSSLSDERVNNRSLRTQLSISETEPIYERGRIHSDAEPNEGPSSLSDEADYYALTHNPRGLCVVINNENFPGRNRNRAGTQADAEALQKVFESLGFTLVFLNDMTAGAMRQELNDLGKENFIDHDALVVCVLSHGENGCVFGIDEQKVSLRELTEPFTSNRARTLAGKPKLFFIQACQGAGYQEGSLPCPSTPRQEEEVKLTRLEEDAGPIRGETVPWGADFLLGMATVPECKSFRNTSTGSIYIQELCRQLERSARSRENDDILAVLTRVNRNVSKGEYLSHKQMPEPKYTLTRKLVLKFV